MKLENSMAVADKVLKEVRRKLVGVKGYSGSIYPYKNGRENGYSILVHSNRSDFPVESRRVFFSENRNSDNIVVYPEQDKVRVFQDNISDEAYEDRIYFKYNQQDKAAKYIVRFLTSWRNKEN